MGRPKPGGRGLTCRILVKGVGDEGPVGGRGLTKDRGKDRRRQWGARTGAGVGGLWRSGGEAQGERKKRLHLSAQGSRLNRIEEVRIILED